MSIYEVDLSFYKETRGECNMSSYFELLSIAREMIYYNHWTNLVMFEFLNSNNDISIVIENVQIKALSEYVETGSLF